MCYTKPQILLCLGQGELGDKMQKMSTVARRHLPRLALFRGTILENAERTGKFNMFLFEVPENTTNLLTCTSRSSGQAFRAVI